MSNVVPFFENVDPDFKATETVGSFSSANRANSFDSVYTEACDNMLRIHNTKMNGGFLTADSLSNQVLIGDFRKDLLAPFEESAEQLQSAMQQRYGVDATDIGNAQTLYDQMGKLFDNKIEQFTEQASVGQLLPIKAIDFPIMMKTQVKQSFKDVVNEEITPSMVVKKQIEHKIVYAKQDPKKRWEYPQCFFNDEFKEMMQYGRGTKLDTKAVTLPIYNYDIIDELTEAPIPSRERLVIDIEIDKIEVAATDSSHTGSVPNVVITLPVPMRVNLADGAWVGGKIN